MFIEQVEAIQIFGNQLIDLRSFGELLLRMVIDIAVVTVIIRLIFYPKYPVHLCQS